MGEAHRAFTSMDRVLQRTTTNSDNKVSKLIDQVKARTDEFTPATNNTIHPITPTETLGARMRAYGTAVSVGVFIGAAVFLATKPGYGTQGLLLAFSGGVYVYVAATEAAHTFLHKPLSICMKFGVFICFAIGAVAIGLVLLDHEHCSGNEGGSGDGGAHAGHNH